MQILQFGHIIALLWLFGPVQLWPTITFIVNTALYNGLRKRIHFEEKQHLRIFKAAFH